MMSLITSRDDIVICATSHVTCAQCECEYNPAKLEKGSF